jgi:hypothetical protein
MLRSNNRIDGRLADTRYQRRRASMLRPSAYAINYQSASTQHALSLGKREIQSSRKSLHVVGADAANISVSQAELDGGRP